MEGLSTSTDGKFEHGTGEASGSLSSSPSPSSLIEDDDEHPNGKFEHVTGQACGSPSSSPSPSSLIKLRMFPPSHCNAEYNQEPSTSISMDGNERVGKNMVPTSAAGGDGQARGVGAFHHSWTADGSGNADKSQAPQLRMFPANSEYNQEPSTSISMDGNELVGKNVVPTSAAGGKSRGDGEYDASKIGALRVHPYGKVEDNRVSIMVGIGSEDLAVSGLVEAWGVEDEEQSKTYHDLQAHAAALEAELKNAPKATIVVQKSDGNGNEVTGEAVAVGGTGGVGGRYKKLQQLVAVVAVTLIGLLVLVVVVVRRPDPSSTTTNASTASLLLNNSLQAIQDRGYIRCIGLWAEMQQGDGISVSLCSTLAAAILGDKTKYEMVFISFRDQWASIANGTVDISTRKTTPNMERDIKYSSSQTGFTFSAPYFYAGLSFAGVPEYLDCIDSLEQLADGVCRDVIVCSLESSIHADFIRENMEGISIELVSTYEQMHEVFAAGTCNVMSGSPLDFTEALVRTNGYTGPYAGSRRLYNRDPLAVTTRNIDTEFGDFCDWILRALIVAEVRNITQSTAHQFPTTNLFGENFTDMFQNAIGANGNYGELYARHLESKLSRAGAGKINVAHTNAQDGGLLYPNPLGSTNSLNNDNLVGVEAPRPAVNGTLEGIDLRQQLKCAIISNPWNGMDIDFCKGLGAALFGGDVGERLVVNNYETVEEGFVALANNEVDVLAGATFNMANDVREPTTGQGFGFSDIYYYHEYPRDDDNDAEVLAVAMATREDDVQWTDFVRSMITSTIYAEDKAITQATGMEMPLLGLFGPAYQLALRDVIWAIGNYAEIYDRNMEQYIPRVQNTRNTLNMGQTPQLYGLWKF